MFEEMGQPAFATFNEFLEQNLSRELLRFSTAGSVDDGKSTLIGRLLHDSKAVYEDQLVSIQKSRVNRSSGPIDFSLLTDGLRAEREQGITIDVAYRYFATPQRKFIIADTPGHEQYTRNMATGASTADLAVILIDGSKGILRQTRRHTYISSLLGIRHILAAVNKMDLVDFREEIFLKLESDFMELAQQLGLDSVQCIPISALQGDNVVDRSSRTPWYDGPTLLQHLERVPVDSKTADGPFRLPVQYVLRPDANFRGFSGQVAGGTVHPGDTVVALPSGRQTKVKNIVTYDGNLPEAFHPLSIALQLEDEIDLSRGDVLVGVDQKPIVASNVEAMIVWMHQEHLHEGTNYLVKHGVRVVRGKVNKILYRVDVNTTEQQSASELAMNDIASIELETASPLFFDPYQKNRNTGSFILIDPLSNLTVAAGMIRGEVVDKHRVQRKEKHTAKPKTKRTALAAADRHARMGHLPATIVLSGRPKVAELAELELFEHGFHVMRISHDQFLKPALGQVLEFARTAGLVVIYSRDESKHGVEFTASPDSPVFDFDKIGLDLSDEVAVRQILDAVRSLRLSDESDKKKVN